MASVHWAARIVATRSSKGLEWSSMHRASGNSRVEDLDHLRDALRAVIAGGLAFHLPLRPSSSTRESASTSRASRQLIDVVLREPAFSRDAHAVAEILHPFHRMRVGADRDLDALLLGRSVVPPVEVETMRVGVDLDDHVFDRAAASMSAGTSTWYPSRASKQPPRRVAEDRRVRILDRADDPPGHVGFAHAEVLMDGDHDEIEEIEDLGRIIERSVGEDVRLDPVKNAKALELFVERRRSPSTAP